MPVTLLSIHTSVLPWSSNKLSRNQLFTLNDFRKLALLLQPEYFKCQKKKKKQICWKPHVKKVHKLLEDPASCILF